MSTLEIVSYIAVILSFLYGVVKDVFECRLRLKKKRKRQRR